MLIHCHLAELCTSKDTKKISYLQHAVLLR
jgi:hypothetical protein